MTPATRILIRNLISRPFATLCPLFAMILLLLSGGGAKAENETLYSYFAHGFCATTYDTVNLAITIKVDASTPDGIYQIRYNRISQAGPDSYDPFCNFWVSNGIITAAEWPGTGIGTSSFTFGGGIASGTSGGGLRYYDYSNYAHKVEWPVSEGGTIDVGPCPAPDGIVYPGAMTLDFGGGGIVTPEDHTKETDTKRGGDECGGGPGMAAYSAHARVASLNIQDTPIGYSPARGPSANFTVRYNQRENQQPQTFAYANLGSKWNFGWLAYLTVNPLNPSANVALHAASGGVEVYGGFDSGSQTYTIPEAQSHALLVKTGADTYERRLPDGSKQVFARAQNISSSVRNVFMTQLVDAAGNAATIGYDASFRVTNFTDALGYATTLSYELPGDPLKITKVTEPFPTGRTATFSYTNGQLTTITDTIGIQSRFHYSPGTDFIDSLTTPYGTSTFATGESGTNRWIEMTDPEGGLERIEYRDNAPGLAPTEPDGAPWPISSSANANLDVANSFYWSKKATQMYPPVNGVYDYTKAQIVHWATDAKGIVTGIIASQKEQLEGRVWYDHADANNANPSTKSRWNGPNSYHSNNGQQYFKYEYNVIGKTTKSTDPVGRVTTYIYAANNIDLLEVRRTNGGNDLLRKYTYNAQHLPLTETDAAGQVTTYTYNAQGQMLTRKNAKNETTTYTYGGTVPDGYLASITSPPFNAVSAITRFTYDSANRVRTVTDADSYAVTTDYDNLDRKIKVTYPDTTFEQFQYTDNGTGAMTLDLTGERDRRGLWTYRHYNGNRQMDAIADPANRTTLYGWCTCGALTSITDPKNQTTNFNRDVQGRIYQKVFQDGTTIDYLYEGQTAPNTVGGLSTRLQSSTDAKGQRTSYEYTDDDNIAEIRYTDMAGQPLSPPTPKVVYTYDYRYNRVSSMTDASGPTGYGYNAITVPPVLGAGRLASVDSPIANDTITFTYDQLGRVITRAINGTANSETWTFDSLGRVSTDVNKLGTFTNTFVAVTNRLSKMTYPGGATANYTYFPNSGDKRLQQIKHLTSKSALISQFDYTYDAEGEIRTWTKNYAGLAAPQRFDLGYDNADELTTAPLKNATSNALIKQYTYGYDAAANRTSELVGTSTTVSTPNNINEITAQSGGTNRTLSYDLNGNVTSDGGTRTFEWDAANHLIAVNYTGQTTRSEFTYDGLGRVAKIVEKTGSTINSTRKIVWCGNDKCEFRDAADAVTLRLYPQGELSGTKPNFYTRDHLGSIREMFGSTGTVGGRYDYDPYGRSTTLLATTPTDMNFTGLYRHAKSNLDLATQRAYDPDLGRWLSRDPIAERGGLNLYGYVQNNPPNRVDLIGLAPGDWWDVRTPAYLADQASRYAEGYRGKNGNDSDHHSIAVRDFGDRAANTYGSRAIGAAAAFLGSVFGNWAELLAPSDDWAEDMDANDRGFWDYLYRNKDRSEVPPNECRCPPCGLL
ncbi:MAG TPA: RHS repeat-associated core domain-containing protein [Chthoniobacterales bacterium]|nr:RHS repeat-associated core domain-containing protein [Chthoniobacterales bacterium]